MFSPSFCPKCGGPDLGQQVPPGDTHERLMCRGCGYIHYVNPKIIAGCIIEQDGKYLLCQRAIPPRPGTWTLPAGFMEAGETTEQAIERRCRFEVGVEIAHLTPIAADFRYCEIDPSGIVENEICPVFAAQIVSPLRVNPDEVVDYQWVELTSLLCALEATPWAFSPWMVSEAANAREKLRQFADNLKA